MFNYFCEVYATAMTTGFEKKMNFSINHVHMLFRHHHKQEEEELAVSCAANYFFVCCANINSFNAYLIVQLCSLLNLFIHESQLEATSKDTKVKRIFEDDFQVSSQS